jgi:hypothetical protein
VQFIGRTAVRLRHRRKGLQHLELQGLVALAAHDHAELDPLTLLQVVDAGGQGGLVHEDVSAVVLSEKAKAFVGVVPLDATRWHSESLATGDGSLNCFRLSITTVDSN